MIEAHVLKRNVLRLHGRMARGGHGLPKVSLGPAMPNPFITCGRATPETAVSRVARPQGGRSVAVFYLLGHPTPYVSASINY